MTFGCKDVVIKKYEFVARSQLLCYLGTTTSFLANGFLKIEYVFCG